MTTTDPALTKALDRYYHLLEYHRMVGNEAALLTLAAAVEDATIVSIRHDSTPATTPVTSTTTPISAPVADATEIIRTLPPLPEITVTIPVQDQAVRSIRERYLQD